VCRSSRPHTTMSITNRGNGLYFTNSTSTEGNVLEMASNPNGVRGSAQTSQ
jgi:hypothetical protein